MRFPLRGSAGWPPLYWSQNRRGDQVHHRNKNTVMLYHDNINTRYGFDKVIGQTSDEHFVVSNGYHDDGLTHLELRKIDDNMSLVSTYTINTTVDAVGQDGFGRAYFTGYNGDDDDYYLYLVQQDGDTITVDFTSTPDVGGQRIFAGKSGSRHDVMLVDTSNSEIRWYDGADLSFKFRVQDHFWADEGLESGLFYVAGIAGSTSGYAAFFVWRNYDTGSGQTHQFRLYSLDTGDFSTDSTPTIADTYEVPYGGTVEPNHVSTYYKNNILYVAYRHFNPPDSVPVYLWWYEIDTGTPGLHYVGGTAFDTFDENWLFYNIPSVEIVGWKNRITIADILGSNVG